MFVRIKSWGISHSLPSLSFRFKLQSCLYSVCEIHPLIRGDNPITQQSLEYSTGRPQSKYLAIGIFLGVSLRCINQINLILLFLCCTSVFFTLYFITLKEVIDIMKIPFSLEDVVLASPLTQTKSLSFKFTASKVGLEDKPRNLCSFPNCSTQG